MAKGRILIIERDAIIALDLAESLELADYQVCCVACKSEALEEARRFRPELAVVDADAAGPLDLEILHAEQRCGLVYLTTQSHGQAWLVSSLPLVFLRKPFSPLELMAATAAAIAMRRPAGLSTAEKGPHNRSCSPARDAALSPLSA